MNARLFTRKEEETKLTVANNGWCHVDTLPNFLSSKLNVKMTGTQHFAAKPQPAVVCPCRLTCRPHCVSEHRPASATRMPKRHHKKLGPCDSVVHVILHTRQVKAAEIGIAGRLGAGADARLLLQQAERLFEINSDGFRRRQPILGPPTGCALDVQRSPRGVIPTVSTCLRRYDAAARTTRQR